MQKKENVSPKNNKNMQNIKKERQKSKEKIIIQKYNNNFTKNNKKNKNNINQSLNNPFFSSNPFICNNENNNTGDMEFCHSKEESESNINIVSTNKSTKMLEIKKPNKKKNNYRTKTNIKSQVNTMEILSQSNPFINPSNTSRNDKKLSKRINTNSYKSSTHKQSKKKKFITISQNPINNTGVIINTKSEKNFSNKKVYNKLSISPDIKCSPKNIHNKSLFDAKKIQNYTEIYKKHNKMQNNQSQRINTINKALHNNVKMLKSEYSLNNRLNYSNEKLINQDNNSGNKQLYITKEGKRYVLSKNVQRIRRENFKIKAEERTDFLTYEDDKINKTVNQ